MSPNSKVLIKSFVRCGDLDCELKEKAVSNYFKVSFDTLKWYLRNNQQILFEEMSQMPGFGVMAAEYPSDEIGYRPSPNVRVHALFVALGGKKALTLGSHIKLHVKQIQGKLPLLFL
ncbi:hypothetical protein R1flu_015767 [Riccia fluitans]|uniref:Transposase n=1 Tax=Riccia fluitans TaxID=41844 RepID=A0ABD1YJW3_9MARC